MIRGMTLVTTALVALAPLTASATPARPASATPGAVERPNVAARATRGLHGSEPLPVALPPAASVISLSVVPTSDRAELVIGVDGPVDVQDFTLRDPDKIVVDVTGATLGIGAESYDRVTRAGIINVRYSQYRKNVVRVVLTLDGAKPYSVVRGKHEVRVSVEGHRHRLVTWHVGYDTPTSTLAEQAAKVDTRPAARSTAAKVETTELRTATPKVAEPRGTPTTPSRFVAMQQRSQQPRITIAWENADIHDVLAAFAAFSGRTILPSREVYGPVTAEISNQPWDVAMRAILNANGFDAVRDANGIIHVDTFQHLISRQNAEPLMTRTIRLNYARSNSVAEMVHQRLSRDCSSVTIPGTPAQGGRAGTPAVQLNPNCPVRGAVTADSLTNSLSITDIPTNLDELESYARSIDLRQ